MKYFRILSFLFVTCVICIVESRMNHASYTRTSIIDTDCDASTQIKSEYFNRKIDCSLMCNDESDCRRYLYCELTNQCILYRDGRNCMMKGSPTGCHCYKKRIGYIDGVSTCPWGRYGSDCSNIITDCNHGSAVGISSPTTDILADIHPPLAPEPFEVLCTFGYGGWTIVFYRSQDCETGNFNRTLDEYEEGFGPNVHLNGWLGFKNWIYVLGGSNNPKTAALIIFKPDGTFCNNYYNQFRLGTKTQFYNFTSTGVQLLFPSGTGCGDSLIGSINLNGMKFSTIDADFSASNCVNRFGTAWWYSDTHSDCSDSLLTGTTDGSGTDNFWKQIQGSQPLYRVQMKIR